MAAGMNRNVLFKANPILLFHNFEASPRSGVGAVRPHRTVAKGDKTRMQSQAPGRASAFVVIQRCAINHE